MDIEKIREYCLSKKGATESFPFDDTALVFKVANKMFALLDLSSGNRINLKCDPDLAISLREQYSCVIPGYHMSKKHWNTIIIDNSVPDTLIIDWVNHSYDLVFSGLSKKLKDEINNE